MMTMMITTKMTSSDIPLLNSMEGFFLLEKKNRNPEEYES